VAQKVAAALRAQGVDPPDIRPISNAQHATAAARPLNSRLDCTRLREAFGLALPPWDVTLEEALAHWPVP